jgi:hypothetical protein
MVIDSQSIKILTAVCNKYDILEENVSKTRIAIERKQVSVLNEPNNNKIASFFLIISSSITHSLCLSVVGDM